jgi:hypothetical protein
MGKENTPQNAISSKQEIDSILTAIILENSVCNNLEGDAQICRATKSDTAIAVITGARIGRKVSDDKIRRLRLANNIFGLNPGWQAAGPGRPQGSPGKRNNIDRACRGHKLTISDADVVGWCSSIYAYDQGKLVLSLKRAGVKPPNLTNLPRSWKPGLAFGGGGSLGKQGGRSDRSMITSSMK